MIDNLGKTKSIEIFCQKAQIDQKYFKHSDLDIFLNFQLTGIFNYVNLLTRDECEFIDKTFNVNYKYRTEIESNKQQIIDDKNNEMLKLNKDGIKIGNINANNLRDERLLSFDIPEFEIYFTISLIVGGIRFEPELITDITLNSKFNHNLIVRFKYKDLTPDSMLEIKVFSVQLPKEKEILGIAKLNLFDSKNTLVQGRNVFVLNRAPEQKNKIVGTATAATPNTASTAATTEPTCPIINTSGASNTTNNEPKSTGATTISVNHSQSQESAKVFKEIRKLMKNFNKITEQSKKSNTSDTISSEVFFKNFDNKLNQLLAISNETYLEVTFPSFNIPVVHEEEPYPIANTFFKELKFKQNEILLARFNNWVCDPDLRKGKNFLSKDNPITEKFSVLSRISDDAFARDIRPTHNEDLRIQELINTPDFIKLDDSDTILFWKYRYYLLNRKACLTKILNAVKWGDGKIENEFIQNILNKWTEVEIGDILYMLSHKFCLNPVFSKNFHPKEIEVRNFAVKYLEKIENKDLNFILLQLVQALRYEDPTNSALRDFLTKACAKNIELASSFFWFLKVEADDSDITNKNKDGMVTVQQYHSILEEFMGNIDIAIYEQLQSQIMLREKLISVAVELGKSKSAEARKNRLQQIVRKEGSHDLSKISPPLQLPLESSIRVNGTVTEKCRVFVSAKNPIKYAFTVAPDCLRFNRSDDPSLYEIMFKYGDDLRQDQVILQIISFMDNLLKKVHLDYEFTTYKVLATSKSDGFVEFVPDCLTISDILKKFDNKIRPYLDSNAYDEEAKSKLLDSFINSCAGYCVVTYILGIGDRHLENLLIDKKGRLLHIDFGFILGEDPKIYPPPMKLCKQMVECIGGKNSKEYEIFLKKCVNAYNCLRSNARLIVNMFYLMINSGIPILSENSLQVLNKLHEKFVPHMKSEDAAKSLLNKLEESVNAFYPVLMDTIHEWAKYWK